MTPTTVALGYLALICSPILLPLAMIVYDAARMIRERREFRQRAD